MTFLELVGSVAIWIFGTYVACLISIIIGNFFGRNKEMAGLIYVTYPPIIVAILSTVIGLVLLGRALA